VEESVVADLFEICHILAIVPGEVREPESLLATRTFLSFSINYSDAEIRV
jgi:hypothetical protein